VPEIQPAYFSRLEFSELLKAIEERDFRELVFFAVSTGFRLGEIIALQWGDVDFAAKLVQVRNSATFTTKSKKNRAVPMTGPLYAMLLGRRERPVETPFVFHQKGKCWTVDLISHTFKDCVRKAKLNDELHFHSLRHTFASWLAADGVSLFAIQKLLGHSSSRVTEIYSHLQPEQLHQTVNRLDIQLN
jgi:integrase